jgi:hypothetical protein
MTQINDGPNPMMHRTRIGRVWPWIRLSGGGRAWFRKVAIEEQLEHYWIDGMVQVVAWFPVSVQRMECPDD